MIRQCKHCNKKFEKLGGKGILCSKKCRFFSQIKFGFTPNDCWIWIGWKDKRGYGSMKYNYIPQKAHRIILEILHINIPTNKIVMHSCDNPSCVNPLHLEIGTNKDNTQDAVRKNRMSHQYGENNAACKIKNKDILKIKDLYNELNLTQKEISQIFNVSRACIGLILNNKRRI